MRFDIQYRINNDINLKNFLKENSYWYKDLNRNSDSFKYFVNDMKEKYKLTTADKLNKISNDINMFRSFLEVLK